MEISQTEIYNHKRQDCWNSALHSFGYGYLHNLKAKSIQKILRLNTFLGVLIPVVIGGLVLSFGLEFKFLKIFIFIASVLGLLQLVLSLYIITYHLEEKHSHLIESSVDNYRLAEEYEKLARYPPDEYDVFEREIDKVDVKRTYRDSSDSRYQVGEKSKRKGMRYSLRKYRRSCAGCGNVPVDMKPTNCGVCGDF